MSFREGRKSKLENRKERREKLNTESTEDSQRALRRRDWRRG
jgi:hypothetical protein